MSRPQCLSLLFYFCLSWFSSVCCFLCFLLFFVPWQFSLPPWFLTLWKVMGEGSSQMAKSHFGEKPDIFKYVHSMLAPESSKESLENFMSNCLVSHGAPLSVASVILVSHVLCSLYLCSTSLQHPQGASLWFITPTSLGFCVVGEPLNFDPGNIGTFTCSVPSSGQMHLITESMFFSSHLSGVQNMLNCCTPSAQFTRLSQRC